MTRPVIACYPLLPRTEHTVDAHLCLAPVRVCAPINAFVNEWPIRLPVSRGPWLTVPRMYRAQRTFAGTPSLCRVKRSLSLSLSLSLPILTKQIVAFPFDDLLARVPSPSSVANEPTNILFQCPRQPGTRSREKMLNRKFTRPVLIIKRFQPRYRQSDNRNRATARLEQITKEQRSLFARRPPTAVVLYPRTTSNPNRRTRLDPLEAAVPAVAVAAWVAAVQAPTDPWPTAGRKSKAMYLHRRTATAATAPRPLLLAPATDASPVFSPVTVSSRACSVPS